MDIGKTSMTVGVVGIAGGDSELYEGDAGADSNTRQDITKTSLSSVNLRFAASTDASRGHKPFYAASSSWAEGDEVE